MLIRAAGKYVYVTIRYHSQRCANNARVVASFPLGLSQFSIRFSAHLISSTVQASRLWCVG